MNQFEAIAELGIVPINLGEHIPFHTIYPANLRILAAIRFLLTFVLLWHLQPHMLKLLPCFLIQNGTSQDIGIHIIVFE